MAGSLAMAKALDPEDTHALMDGFFALVLEAVHREGGTLNQFRGDGFMALFGAPRARGDDPARALRAALAVREQARAYADSVRARFGLPFAVRLGVSSGVVWVGAIGNELRRDYTAEGPTVGLAARLEACASPGQILVSEDSVRRCGSYFELVDLGPRALRGLPEPVRVFELVREGRLGARLAVERERGLTPFVGRAAELAQLDGVLGTGGGLRCLEIRGEVGVGKSRLVHELAQRPREALRLVELGCRESGAQRAYLPLLEALRRWPEAAPGAAGAARLLAALEGRAGSPPEPERVAASFREILGALLADSPLLLLVDDAQWIDPSSRALLGRLCADPPAGSLALVATLRGDALGDWGAREPVATLRLGPLAAADARRLAQSILAGLSRDAELAELAELRGGGNPLFVEEVARALREGSASLREAARYEASLARLHERVPETLQDVVAARIDALPERAKRVLEVAAVVGEPFAADLLRDIEPEEGADALLDELAERGLLSSDAGGEYDFCHGVVRSGAYGQLVRERRSALHRRVADAFAKRPGADSAGGAARLAGHYDRAGDAAAALLNLQRAAAGYVALRALAEAAVHLRRALELVREAGVGDRRLETSLGVQLAGALSALDRSGEAAAVLEGLDVEAAALGDRPRIAMARIQIGWVRYSNDNEVDRPRRLVESGLRLAEGLEGAEDVALLGHGYLSRIELADGELERALAAARRLCELASARADSSALVLGLHHEAGVHGEAGRVSEARRVAARALFEAQGQANEFTLGTAQLALARVHILEGDVESALAAARSVADAGERLHQAAFSYHGAALRGQAQLLAGSPRAAHEAFESLAQQNDRWPTTSLYRARGFLEIGDLDAAAEHAARCLAATPARSFRARALAVRGLALGLAGGRRDEAEALLGESLELCDALGLRPSLAEAQVFLAELCARRGDAARAQHHARRGHDEYASCGMPRHAELALSAADA